MRPNCIALVLLLPVFAVNAEPPRATGAVRIDPADEAPKGLVILPWKPAEPGELPTGPLRRVDVPIAPLDPEVFEREIQLLTEETQP